MHEWAIQLCLSCNQILFDRQGRHVEVAVGYVSVIDAGALLILHMFADEYL